MTNFDPQSPRDYTPRFSWWWLLMGIVVLVAMFIDALCVPIVPVVMPRPIPPSREVVSRFWIKQLYAGQPQITVTQARLSSNNNAMNVRVPAPDPLSLLALGCLFLVWRKRGAA